MTDKQIIIEGGVCLNCGAKTKKHILICDKCTEEMGTVIAHKFTIDKQTKEIKQLNKQLKRKEQECEELKKQYNCYACDTCKGKEDYINIKRHCENAIKSLHNKQAELDQLKAENDELKKWKENIIDLFNRTCRCKHLNEETEICGLNNKKCISINECMYRKQQTLTEIKEIVEKGVKIHDDIIVSKQILQKISEVEDG